MRGEAFSTGFLQVGEFEECSVDFETSATAAQCFPVFRNRPTDG